MKQLFFCALFVTIAFSAQCQTNATTKSGNALTKPPATATGKKQYKNDSIRISLYYPADLTVVDKSNNKDQVLNVAFGKNITLNNLLVFESGPEYAVKLEENLKKNLPAYDTGSKTYSTFGQNKLFNFTSSFTNQGTKYYSQILVYPASAGNTTGCYALTIFCTSADFDKYTKMAGEIAATIKELPNASTNYSNKKLHVAFQYPSNWKMEEQSGRTIMRFSKNDISIWNESGFFGGYSSGATLKEIAEKDIAFYREKTDHILIEQHEFTSKGKKIYLVKAMYMGMAHQPFISLTYIATFLENNIAKPFKIICTYPFAQETKYAPYFEQFIKNIQFDKPLVAGKTNVKN